jgi:hypothetical protein
VVLGSEKRIPQRLIVLEPPTTAADQTLKQFTAGTNQRLRHGGSFVGLLLLASRARIRRAA